MLYATQLLCARLSGKITFSSGLSLFRFGSDVMETFFLSFSWKFSIILDVTRVLTAYYN